MKLLRLESGLWDVTAVVQADGETCPLTDFLSSLEENYQGSVSGLYDLFERFAASGPATFNDAICHYVDRNNKIWEFIKGDLRILWFYGSPRRIIVCTHGLVKKSPKTPSRDVNRAIALKAMYEADVNQGHVEILEDK